MAVSDGRVPSEPGSREPDPQAVPALTGFDPSRGELVEIGGREHALRQALTDWANRPQNMHRPASDWPLYQDWSDACLALEQARRA